MNAVKAAQIKVGKCEKKLGNSVIGKGRHSVKTFLYSI